jgi:hypothetical protein
MRSHENLKRKQKLKRNRRYANNALYDEKNNANETKQDVKGGCFSIRQMHGRRRGYNAYIIYEYKNSIVL